MMWTRQFLSALPVRTLVTTLMTTLMTTIVTTLVTTLLAMSPATSVAADVVSDAQVPNSSPVQASPTQSSPRLDAVFKSLQTSTQGGEIHVPVKPIGLLATGFVLMTIAVKQWNRRQASPKPLSNHRKLLGEVSQASGVSKRKLKRIAPLASADGLSSPLVAVICPSAIKRLAAVVKTADEQEALKAVAQTLYRAQGLAGAER